MKTKTMNVDEMIAGQRENAKWEYCSCGCRRSQHTDNIGGLAVGHGYCTGIKRRRVCKCQRFTWAGDLRNEKRTEAGNR